MRVVPIGGGSHWRAWIYRLSPLLLVIGLIVLWWVATDLILRRPRVYPGPVLVGEYILEVLQGDTGHGPTLPNVAATMFRLGVAWGASMVIGTLLGIMAGRSKFVFDFLENLVWVFMATPSIVWVFIYVVAIGLSDLVPIIAISMLLTPHVLIVVGEGAKSVPRSLLDVADSYRAGRIQRIRDLYLPFLTPYILGSGRNAFALATKLILVAEVVGLSRGIGYVVKFWRDQTWFAPVLAWGVLLTAFGIIVDYLVFRRLQLRMQGWTERGAPAATAQA